MKLVLAAALLLPLVAAAQEPDTLAAERICRPMADTTSWTTCYAVFRPELACPAGGKGMCHMHQADTCQPIPVRTVCLTAWQNDEAEHNGLGGFPWLNPQSAVGPLP